MDRFEYMDEIWQGIEEWIDENHYYYDRFDSAWCEMQDAVTGSDNGSHYCNSVRAEEALAGVLFDDVVYEACVNAGYRGIPVHLGPELCDVAVRVALMERYLYPKAERYWDEVKEEEDEEE